MKIAARGSDDFGPRLTSTVAGGALQSPSTTIKMPAIIQLPVTNAVQHGREHHEGSRPKEQ